MTDFDFQIGLSIDLHEQSEMVHCECRIYKGTGLAQTRGTWAEPALKARGISPLWTAGWSSASD